MKFRTFLSVPPSLPLLYQTYPSSHSNCCFLVPTPLFLSALPFPRAVSINCTTLITLIQEVQKL